MHFLRLVNICHRVTEIMLTPQQESNLTSGGDCHEHFHTADRQVSHETLSALISLETSISVIDGTIDVPAGTDYVIVDTSSGSATLNLPLPSKKLSVTIVRLSASNTLTIQSPTGTVNGGATYTGLTGAYAFGKFKAINGNYYRVA